MFQKQDGDLVESDGAAPEERAYEDNWYRSLKALSEQRQDEADGDQEPDVEDLVAGPVDAAPVVEDLVASPVDAAPDDQVPTWAEDPAHVEPEHVETEHVETEHVETPEAPTADAPTPTDRERLVSEEFETRAGQLLERLRSIQHLGER
jgi:hypothetical protein